MNILMNNLAADVENQELFLVLWILAGTPDHSGPTRTSLNWVSE